MFLVRILRTKIFWINLLAADIFVKYTMESQLTYTPIAIAHSLVASRGKFKNNTIVVPNYFCSNDHTEQALVLMCRPDDVHVNSETSELVIHSGDAFQLLAHEISVKLKTQCLFFHCMTENKVIHSCDENDRTPINPYVLVRFGNCTMHKVDKYDSAVTIEVEFI